MDLVANATSSRIKPIGRLGRNSKGLLLFTNDDVIVDKFTNSKNGVARLFHIELNKNLKLEDLKKIQEGFKVQGKLISVEEISYIDGASKKEIGLKHSKRIFKSQSLIREICITRNIRSLHILILLNYRELQKM